MGELKAICFDIDGTLINDDKQISERTKSAVHECVGKHGCRVVLASSRMPRSIRVVEAELGLRCDIVAFDGAFVSPSGSKPIPGTFEEIDRYSSDALNDLKFGEELFCGLFLEEKWLVTNAGHWLGREMRSTKVQPDIVDEDEVRSLIKRGSPITKIMFRGTDKAMFSVQERLKLSFNNASCHSNKPSILEFLPPTATKAKGVREIVSKGLSDLNGVLAFGDGHNDIPLLRASEWSVAMGNAVDDCKRAAKFVTGDNNSDGIADFLYSNFV